MNTNLTGLRCFFQSLCPCALNESSLSIGRVNNMYQKISRLCCHQKNTPQSIEFFAYAGMNWESVLTIIVCVTKHAVGMTELLKLLCGILIIRVLPKHNKAEYTLCRVLDRIQKLGQGAQNKKL